MVPGGGIEPPTRGFSVHCSTPELPGHGDRAFAWSGRRLLMVVGWAVQRSGAKNQLLRAKVTHFSDRTKLPAEMHALANNIIIDTVQG